MRHDTITVAAADGTPLSVERWLPEGEATATYLVRMLRDIPGLTVTRIASGLPMGGDLEFADELTLGRALAGRRAMV